MQSSLGRGTQETQCTANPREMAKPALLCQLQRIAWPVRGSRELPGGVPSGPSKMPHGDTSLCNAVLARSRDTGLEHCLWGSPSPSVHSVPVSLPPGEVATHWLSVGSFRSSGRTLKKSNRCGQREIFTGNPMRPLKYSVSVPWRLSAARCPSNHLGAGWGEPETHEHTHTSPNVCGKGERRRGPWGRRPC